jgi:hypothetical protein
VRPGLIHHFGWRDGHGGCDDGAQRICDDEAQRIYGDGRRIGFDGTRKRIVSALYIIKYIIIIMEYGMELSILIL